MNTKLTLRLDDALIARAKDYARTTGRSVSQLVADYFSVLGANSKPDAPSAPPDIVLSLHGLLAGADVEESDYQEYLERKHGLR